jgi:hypothetical protein
LRFSDISKGEKMKLLLLLPLLISPFVQAQTTTTATYAAFNNAQDLQTAATSTCVGLCTPFADIAAYIILPNSVSQQPLTLDETHTLRDALAVASDLGNKAAVATADLKAQAVAASQAAIVALQTAQNRIAASHGWDSSTSSTMPYQINYQEATVLSYAPAVWKKVGTEGQTVHLTKGTIIRYGAPKGTPRGYPADGLPLPTDSFLSAVTLTQDMDLTVGTGSLMASDPAYGYLKELDVEVVGSSTGQ